MTIKVRGHRIDVQGTPVEIVRRDIKNLHVGVYPPSGRVRVASPVRLDDDAVRLAVVSRLGWIRRKQAKFEQQDRQSQRQFVTGESHYFEGRRYRIDVTERGGSLTVRLLNNAKMALSVRPGTDRDKREAIVHQWYRHQLRSRVPALLAKWEPKVGAQVAEVHIRKMKTRWGTCNRAARRIWLNLELVKKPPACLEYIVVHEMAHLIERSHNDRFRDMMDKLMPQWRMHRDELNRAPLAHADWRY